MDKIFKIIIVIFVVVAVGIVVLINRRPNPVNTATVSPTVSPSASLNPTASSKPVLSLKQLLSADPGSNATSKQMTDYSVMISKASVWSS